MTVPYTFGNQTGPIPLSQLDANFAALSSATGNGVSMIASGADGTGSVDCATVLSTVFAALPDGGMIVFDAGHTFKLSTATLDGKNCTIYAVGAVITCTSNSGGLRKLSHGYKLQVLGGRWNATGTGECIQYVATPNSQIYNELEVANAHFSSTGNWCISLVGCQNTTFSQCEFTSSAGSYGAVYCSKANNPYFYQCVFVGQSVGTAFFADGQGDPASANPILNGCEILTWDTNVYISACDDFQIIGCTIDYAVTNNIVIASQDGGKIIGNFIGGTSGTNAPALTLRSEGPAAYTPINCQKISIIGNAFTGHWATDFTYDTILLMGYSGDAANNVYWPQEVQIQSNNIQFYTRYGINFKALDRMFVLNNTFDPRATFGRVAISNQGADASTNIIAFNGFPAGTNLAPSGLWGANLSQANVFSNTGFYGEPGVGVSGGANSIFMNAVGVTYVGPPPPATGASYWHWTNATGPVRLDRYQNSPTFRLRRANGIITAPTNATGTDALGTLGFDGYNGPNAAYDSMAGVSALCDGTHDATHAPSRLQLNITPTSGGITNAVDVDSSGNVIIDASGNITALGGNGPAIFFHGVAGTSTPGIYSGSGAPGFTASKGSIYLNKTGGAGTCFYVNEAGTNVWVAK